MRALKRKWILYWTINSNLSTETSSGTAGALLIFHGECVYCVRQIEICMSNNQKEYFFYPAIIAIVMSGINAYADWKRGTLESIWWYVVAALIIYAVIALSRYFIYRKRN